MDLKEITEMKLTEQEAHARLAELLIQGWLKDKQILTLVQKVQELEKEKE